MQGLHFCSLDTGVWKGYRQDLGLLSGGAGALTFCRIASNSSEPEGSFSFSSRLCSRDTHTEREISEACSQQHYTPVEYSGKEYP